MRECLERKLRSIRAELHGPTAVERLLVDYLITCWLQAGDYAAAEQGFREEATRLLRSQRLDTADRLLQSFPREVREGSPWLQVVLDTGNFNFCPDPYAEMAALAPHAMMVHAKTYIGGGIYYTADLDYCRIARLLQEAGFHGYLSLEFEGNAHPDQSIPESLALLREAFRAR